MFPLPKLEGKAAIKMTTKIITTITRKETWRQHNEDNEKNYEKKTNT